MKAGEQMPLGYKRIKTDIFYLRKAHICPDCGEKLVKVAVSKVINSRSPEAAQFDFSMGGDTYMIGDVKFVWDELECPSCKKHLTVSEMKQIEGIPLPAKPGKSGKVLFYVLSVLLLAAAWLWNGH